MKDFLKSNHFKIMCLIAAFLVLVMLIVAILGVWSSPQSSLLGTVFSPIQKGAAKLADGVDYVFGAWRERDELRDENRRLADEVTLLRNKLLKYEEVVNQNEQYKEYLGIREELPDLRFEPATVISRSAADSFGTFSIDKGSLAGIKENDPVITADGLVGYVSGVSPTYATVNTILNPRFNVSALDSRTRSDIGIVTGMTELAAEGNCAFTMLAKNSTVAIDDMIITTGYGGVIPSGLLVGRIKEVRQSRVDISMYAVLEPAANIKEIKNVLVITYFAGQGEQMPEPGISGEDTQPSLPDETEGADAE